MPLKTGNIRLIHGDCRTMLSTLPSASVDCVITDPPYPHIKRSYGFWTEEEWFALMRMVVPECMRIVKSSGSAVFVLQPNSEKTGRMRMWLWKFVCWVGREWGLIQDVYWWNNAALPNVHCQRNIGLMRPSVKTCVWIGSNNCYRNQNLILIEPSQATKNDSRVNDHHLQCKPSGYTVRQGRLLASYKERGGVTPFNLLKLPNTDSTKSAGANGHGAGMPYRLADWWLRYICPPGGSVLDPFNGSGTTSLVALNQGKQAIGIETIEEYHRIARQRVFG